MFYLTTHSTHFICGYYGVSHMVKDNSDSEKGNPLPPHRLLLTPRVLLYPPSHKQDNTYHGLCYTSRGALAGMRNSSIGPPHEGSIRRPTSTMSELRPAPDYTTSLFIHRGKSVRSWCDGSSDRSFMWWTH